MKNSKKWNVLDVCAANKRLYLIALLIAVFGSTVVSFSIPEKYASRAAISIDSNDKDPLSKGKGLMFTDIKSILSSSESDVLTEPYIYTKVLKSQSFINGLLKVEVHRNGKERMIFSDYLENNYKFPWWLFFTDKETPSDLVGENIKYELKIKTGMIIVQVCDQNAYIANELVDTVLVHLNAFMTNYMVSKANDNLANKDKARKIAAANYHDAMRKYNTYANANTELDKPNAQAYLKSLENEVERTFDLYDKAVKSWQYAKMEMQRQRPTFFKIKSNTIAIQPCNPKWLQNLFVWIFYAVLFTTWFVLYKKKSEDKKR